MNENPNRFREIMAVLLVLATAVLGVVSLRESIGSFRPASGSTRAAAIGTQDVVARLWEDPFGAVQAANQEKGTNDPIHSPRALRNSFEKRWDEYGGNVRVMAVFEEAMPFPEDREVRLRLRLAVAQALLGKGWRPHDRTHIGYVRLNWAREWPPAGNDSNAADPNVKSILVPYEWFKRDGVNRPAMLVLWVPEEEFADCPLQRLRSLVTHVLPSKLTNRTDTLQSVRLDVIGPRSSDTLRRMATENSTNQSAASRPLCNLLGPVTIYSPHATAPDAALLSLSNRVDSITRAEITGRVVQNLTNVFGTNIVAHFVNLQQTDEVLAWLLVEELKLRGVDVRAWATNGQAAERVVLISEADTFYGRALPTAFLAAACASSGSLSDVRKELWNLAQNDQSDGLTPVTSQSNILRVAYLRGLDGRTARETKADSSQSASSAEDRLRRVFAPSGVDAEGENQFDYIQRLAEQLKKIHHEAKGHAKPFQLAGIRAIGVLGSDPYDKLTLMQGLHPKFPGALFFTTDLDARLWDPDLRGATRNLLVASAYDLTPPNAMAGSGMTRVFRDSYQTATWLAVRAALAKATNSAASLPVVAEIGRHGPVRLKLEPNVTDELTRTEGMQGNNVEDETFLPIRGPAQWMGLCLIIGVPFALVIYQMRKGLNQLHREAARTDDEASAAAKEEMRFILIEQEFRLRWLLISALILAGAACAFCYWGRQPGGEPMALSEGVSIWPTELVRLCVLCLVGGLAFWFWLDHRRRRVHLWRNYFRPEGGADLPPAQKTKPEELLDDAEPISGAPDYARRIEAEKAYLDSLWQGDTRQRFWRVLRYTLVYLAFGFGLFFLWGVPSRPFRGALAGALDFWILLLSVFGFVWLTCYAVDAARLIKHLLQRLAAYPTVWPDHVIKKSAKELGFRFESEEGSPDRELGNNHPLKEALEGWIDVKFAAEATKEMGARFYLPFIVMMLLLISRSSLFDNWPWPPALVLINICSFILVMAVAVMVRQAARRVRARAVYFLDRLIFQAKGESSGSGNTNKTEGPTPTLKQLEIIREKIFAEREGAYSRVIQDPAFLAMLIPTGGYGLFLVLMQMLFGG